MKLTPRESEVCHLVELGLSNKEIGRQLGIREPTVKHHVHNLLLKAGQTSRGKLRRGTGRLDLWHADGRWWCGVRASGQSQAEAKANFLAGRYCASGPLPPWWGHSAPQSAPHPQPRA